MEAEGPWIRSLEDSDSGSSQITLPLTSHMTCSLYLSLFHFLYLKIECLEYMVFEVLLSLMMSRIKFI